MEDPGTDTLRGVIWADPGRLRTDVLLNLRRTTRQENKKAFSVGTSTVLMSCKQDDPVVDIDSGRKPHTQKV